jgi:flagellar hook-associated protein 2
MGTVGINFGSPTSGQGFDVTTTVASIVANLDAVETPWKSQLTTLQGEDTALTSIGTDLSSLSTAVQSLTDFQGVLSGKQGSSSDTDVLQLTSAGTSAVAGSHTVVVSRLASTASYYSDPVAAAGDLLTGSFTVTFGSGGSATTQTIAAASGGESLSDFANTINSADAGVTASVVNGTSGPELTIVSNTSGAAGNFTIAGTLTDATNGGAAISLDNVGQTGVDAQLTVDDIPVTSGSNTVSDAIQGVTFQLLEASAATSVQVEITNDNSAVESAVATFVSDYNTVLGDLNKQEGDDSSGNPEPLYGSPTVDLMQQQLQQALTFAQPAQAVGTISAIAAGDTLSGSLSIAVGGAAATPITVGAGSTPATVAGLATAINNANLGVTASVITSGTAATLSLVNSTSGTSGAITVNSSSLTDSTTGSPVDFSSALSNAVTSITQLGVSVNNDGTLTLDNDTLDSILNSNYQDVVNFLQPSGVFTSFGGNLTTTLDNLANSAPDGALYLALQADQTQETSLNTNITNENAQIAIQQTNLTTELNEANYALEAIPTQLDEINEIYSSITGYNENPS